MELGYYDCEMWLGYLFKLFFDLVSQRKSLYGLFYHLWICLWCLKGLGTYLFCCSYCNFLFNFIFLIKNKGYPLKIMLKRTRRLINKKIFFLEFHFLEYLKWFCMKSCKWGVFCKHIWFLFFFVVLFVCIFSILLWFFIFFNLFLLLFLISKWDC